ncbi:MAG: hypothetical protein L0271_02390 [Gemmatimonadetes bacterium]|nr:hypothetical protein [Gemmatimonadota bacterium]
MKTPRYGQPRFRTRADEPVADRLGSVLCERCGAPLLLDETSDRLLRTLAHLAAFGLAAGGGPILKS